MSVNGLNRQDFPFTVTEEQDNGYLRARIEWPVGNENWDLYLYRVNEDGSLVALGHSRNSASARPFEELESVYAGPGDYIVRVQSAQALTPTWSGAVRFFAPEPPEAYTLTCVNRRGVEVASRQVFVGRGERVDLGDPCRK